MGRGRGKSNAFFGSEVAKAFFASNTRNVRVAHGDYVVVVGKTVRSFFSFFYRKDLRRHTLVEHLLGLKALHDGLHKFYKVVEGLFTSVVHERSAVHKQNKQRHLVKWNNGIVAPLH